MKITGMVLGTVGLVVTGASAGLVAAQPENDPDVGESFVGVIGVIVGVPMTARESPLAVLEQGRNIVTGKD